MSFSRATIGAGLKGFRDANRRVVARLVSRSALFTTMLTLRRCRRGVAALEFAVIAVPLLGIIFGFFAINIMFYTLSTMENAGIYAAQLLAAGKATTANTGTSVSCSTAPASPSVEYYVCNSGVLPGWATFSAASSYDCSVPKVSVTITVDASTAALADVYSVFSGRTLSTTSVAMKTGTTCP